MTKNVLAVCQSCAEHNGGEFKNLRNTPPLFLGQCGCCKDIKACTHIQYWKNIGTQTEMVDPLAEEKAEKAAKAIADAEKAAKKAAEKPAAPAKAAPKASVLG
jgi:hypothetical protein